MDNLIFVGSLAALYGLLLWWAARHLPAEKWQIAASIPVRKEASGLWQGRNLTFYGLFTANALVLACALFLLLLGSVGIGAGQACLFLGPLLLICYPASRLLARWVEKKPATSTIGGAFFASVLVAPWLAYLLEAALAGDLPPAFGVIPMLAALSVSYVLGEGLGRLACISFGCCYGRPLDQGPAWARRLFGRRHFVFSGPLKKASYESGLQGRPLVPIQLITAVVYGAAGLGGVLLFLQGHFTAALLATSLIGGGWRAYSEVLRADFRGERRFTAYQMMALAGTAYTLLMPWLFGPAPTAAPAVGEGLAALWNPGLLLALQALWAFTLLSTGASRVTGATLSFHLNRSQI